MSSGPRPSFTPAPAARPRPGTDPGGFGDSPLGFTMVSRGGTGARCLTRMPLTQGSYYLLWAVFRKRFFQQRIWLRASFDSPHVVRR